MTETAYPELHLSMGASLPIVPIWWPDHSGTLVDFSSGWTFTGAIGRLGDAAIESLATDDFAGAVGTGDGFGDADTPNLTITFDAIDVDDLEPGGLYLTISATRTSDSRVMRRTIRLVIEPIVG